MLLPLPGCATPVERRAVPEALAGEAEIAGMPHIRTWGDGGAEHIQPYMKVEAPRLKAKYGGRGAQPVAHFLALSGGADDGAFGAGLLVGWSEKGDRPEFDLVTGISAGALIAPFAYIGREYDRELAALFTVHGGEDIYQANILPGLLGGSALADSAPLARLIARYVDRRLVARLAEERAKGRLLLVGTTNLDAQRPVFWDLGKIAQHGQPQSITLVRSVLLASASLPGLFPPVSIRVVAGGKAYEEMHVDGGPTREVFFSPADFSFREIDKAVGRPVARRLWIIRNGKTTPEYATVQASTFAISQRSIETLTKNQGIGDLLRMHQRAEADGIDFNLAAIPAEFSAPRPRPFDSGYMRSLYAYAHGLGKAGFAWAKAPPGTIVASR